MKRKIYSKSFKENSVRLMSERSDIPSLARFNRRTKRYTKSLKMLITTLDLFFSRNLVDINY